MKTLPASGYAGTFEKIYSKRITRFALPNCFTFLTGWNTTTAPRIMIKTTFGYLPDNTSVASIFYRVSTSTKLYSIGIEVLTSCTDDANCLTFSYAPQVHSGSIASRSDWRGINISQNTSSYRSDSFNIAFGVFFPNVPKYYAVGLTKIQITTDFKNMSLKVNSVQPQSIDFSLSISPYCILENLWLAVLGSDWGKHF